MKLKGNLTIEASIILPIIIVVLSLLLIKSVEMIDAARESDSDLFFIEEIINPLYGGETIKRLKKIGINIVNRNE